jgi:hypothetical protein
MSALHKTCSNLADCFRAKLSHSGCASDGRKRKLPTKFLVPTLSACLIILVTPVMTAIARPALVIPEPRALSPPCFQHEKRLSVENRSCLSNFVSAQRVTDDLPFQNRSERIALIVSASDNPPIVPQPPRRGREKNDDR